MPGAPHSHDPIAVPPPTAKPSWWSLHLWQIQPLRDILVIVAVLGLLYLGYKLSPLTVPMLLAMMLAYLCEPLVERLTAVRGGRAFTRRGVAVLLILATVLLIIVPAGFGLAVGVTQAVGFTQKFARGVGTTLQAVEKPDDQVLQARVEAQGPAWANLRKSLSGAKAEHERLAALERGDQPQPGVPVVEPDRVSATLYRVGVQAADWVQEHAQLVGKQALDAGGALAVLALAVVGRIGSILFTGFLTAFFFYFFCTRWGRVVVFWRNMIPKRRQERVIHLLMQMDAVIAGFIRGRLTICAILIVWYTLGYWIIGVPAPLILGPVVGVLCILPFIGNLGIPVAMLLLWLSAGSGGGLLGAWQAAWWWCILGPLVVHIGGQVLDDYVLTPRIQGDRTGMNTPTILFASLSGGLLAGFYGLLVAIPVAACLRILLKEVVWPQFRNWAEGRAKDPLPMQNQQ